MYAIDQLACKKEGCIYGHYYLIVLDCLSCNRGGEANLDWLIETAKANRIEPYAYLKTIFTKLLKAISLEVTEALLPLRETSAENDAA